MADANTLKLTKYGEAFLSDDGDFYLQCCNCQDLFTTSQIFRSHIYDCYGILKMESMNNYEDVVTKRTISSPPAKQKSSPKRYQSSYTIAPAPANTTEVHHDVAATSQAEFELILDEEEIEDLPEVKMLEDKTEEFISIVPADDNQNVGWLFEEDRFYQKAKKFADTRQSPAQTSINQQDQHSHIQQQPAPTVALQKPKNKSSPRQRQTHAENVQALIPPEEDMCFNQANATRGYYGRSRTVNSSNNSTQHQSTVSAKLRTKPPIVIKSTLKAISKSTKPKTNSTPTVGRVEKHAKPLSSAVANKKKEYSLLELNIENECFTFFKEK